MKLYEEFKLYENLFEDIDKKHPWMKDVPLVYPELNLGSDPTDPEDDMLIKDFTYLEGPEDVAEVLDTLITEEDVAGTSYDFQTIKTDRDAWYDFLDANFDKLAAKYDEELLDAFEDRAKEAAISDAEDEYYNGNSEYIHETLVPDHDTDIKIVKDVRNLLKELGSGESYIHGSWNQDFVILSGEDRTNSRLRNALKNLGCTELANAHDVNKLLIPKTFKHTDNSLDEAGSKNEDNLARMRRQIRDEIAGYEIEKAFDPDNAYEYDEKIEACKVELARLASLAPSKATLKRRAIKAEQEEKIKEIERRLRWAFKGLFKYFGHPHCKVSKDGSWLIIFRRLTPVATTEAIDICAKAGLQIKHSAEHSDTSSAFRLDIDNLDINNSSFAWLDGIDTEAIKARLEAEQNNTVDDGGVKTNINEENTLMKEYKSYKHTMRSKLSEEFRLYENMWDGEAKELTETSVGVSTKAAKISELRAKIAQLQQELATLVQDDIEDFSSFELEVDGTSKKLKRIGIPHAQALDEIVDFITKLTKEEKDNLTLYWSLDRYDAGDLAGDPIINFDGRNYYQNELGWSAEEIERAMLDPTKRVVDNTWTAEVPEDTYDRIIAVLKN